MPFFRTTSTLTFRLASRGRYIWRRPWFAIQHRSWLCQHNSSLNYALKSRIVGIQAQILSQAAGNGLKKSCFFEARLGKKPADSRKVED
jgi:hypothetical protein